jgi:acyl-[acyl-carrier-protein] desaturase
VLQPVLRHLKVMEVSGLGPEGLAAQQELGIYLDGLDGMATRFDERRAALLARRAAAAEKRG